MATDTMTAPDLDALAGLLEQVSPAMPLRLMHDGVGMNVVASDEGDVLAECCDGDVSRLIAAAVTALPALLATARRERRLREFGAWLRQMRDTSTGETHAVFGGVEAYFAALAEEGQDG